MLRWTIATVLVVAALVDGYLALSESVVWPLFPAALWVLLAVALVAPVHDSGADADIPDAPEAPEPRREPVHV